MTNLNMSYSPSGLVTLASKMSASELGDASFAAEEITNNRQQKMESITQFKIPQKDNFLNN